MHWFVAVLKETYTVFSVLAAGLLIGDYIRLRHDEYLAGRAAKAAAALSGDSNTSNLRCLDGPGCKAHRSLACADGRCRYHCRLYCCCKGNK